MKLTPYQAAQLLHKSMSGDFKYTNKAGHKVARSAWLAMLKALLMAGFIQENQNRALVVTAQGMDFLKENHLAISLSVLD